MITKATPITRAQVYVYIDVYLACGLCSRTAACPPEPLRWRLFAADRIVVSPKLSAHSAHLGTGRRTPAVVQHWSLHPLLL